jgi:guanylate kinase
MATCKDCIHYEICKAYKKGEACDHFLDDTKLMRLPFGTGEVYYELRDHLEESQISIIEFHVDKVTTIKNAYDEVIAIFYEDKKSGMMESALHPEGRRFRTRAEAEIEAEEFLRSRGYLNE